MTETVQAVIPFTEIPVSKPEQAKADILERSLLNAMVLAPEALTATIATTVKLGEEKINALAILQILHRFRLEAVKISALVIHGILAETPFDESVFVPWDDEGLGRTVRLVSHDHDVTLTVTGSQPIKGRNGEILHILFDQGSSAGKILPDGRIDFRELHRYPSVKAGALLMQVSLPATSKSGLTHDGTPIEVPPVKEYPLQLGKNVEKVYTTTEDGRPGYDVKALHEGVVMTRMGPEGIASIDVNDRIVVGDIDFSVGNIGSDVVCPVSLQAQTVHEGFTVKVGGGIFVRTIDGGTVEAGKKAEVDQMRPGSRLSVEGDVTCRSISSSFIEAKNSSLTIKREAIDSMVHAARVIMNASTSLLMSSSISTCALELSNVRVSGENRIILGPGLFSKRGELIKEKERVQTALLEAETILNKTKATLVAQLKNLSAEFGEDDTVRPVFKKIVESLKAYDFDNVPMLMSALKRGNTCMAVNSALRAVADVKRQFHRFQDLEGRVKGLVDGITDVDDRLTAITISINVRLRPSAIINIHLGSKDREPLVVTPPPYKNEDHAIRLKGKFTLESGLVFSEKSGLQN